MAALNVKKQATKKAVKKAKLQGTPVEKILKAAEEFRKKGFDLSYLLK